MAGTFHAREELDNGKPIVVAKIIKTIGSTPRHTGSWMYMREDFSIGGTIGGGALEAETMKIMEKVFETKEDQVYHFRLVEKSEDPNALDMGCGGDADVEIRYIDPEHKDRLDDYSARNPVYMFGAGHVALALDPVLRYVGFDTIVMDDRSEFASRDRFPDATEVRVIEDFNTEMGKLPIDEDSYVVIITRGHKNDYDVLKDAVRCPAAYVGMIGSRKKNEILFGRLREAGYTEDEIQRAYTPIGLPIHAETPEEIAISIVAEMIQVRAGFGTK